MKRIFAAIDISDEARAKVADYMEALRDEFPQIRVGWEQAEKLHLTVKFFGDIDETQLESLVKAIKDTASRISSFRLQISGTGVFPSSGKARILWLGLKDETGSLQRLHELLQTRCEQIGFAKEKKTFNPHLTIARLREPSKSAELVNFHTKGKFTSPSFKVNELIVFQSRLHSNGSEYTPIFRALFEKSRFSIDINFAEE